MPEELPLSVTYVVRRQHYTAKFVLVPFTTITFHKTQNNEAQYRRTLPTLTPVVTSAALQSGTKSVCKILSGTPYSDLYTRRDIFSHVNTSHKKQC